MSDKTLMPVPQWSTDEPPEGESPVLVYESDPRYPGYSLAYRWGKQWHLAGWPDWWDLVDWSDGWAWISLADLPPPPEGVK